MKLHHLKPSPRLEEAAQAGRPGHLRGGRQDRRPRDQGLPARNTVQAGFEGGQMPLTRRVPKWRGFTNPNKEEWAVVNVDSLAGFDADSAVGVGRAAERRASCRGSCP